MSQTTLRPNGTPNTAYSVVGAANEHTATSDELDTTYFTLRGLDPGCDLDFPTVTIPAGGVVKSIQCRARMRWQTNSTDARIGIQYDNGSWIGTSTVHDLTSSWVTYTGTLEQVALSQSDLDNIMVEVYDELLQTELQCSRVYLDLVIAEVPSAPTVSAPTGTVTTTRKPQVQWTFNAGTDGGSQTKFQVKVFTDAQYGAGGFDPETSSPTVNSGTITSSTGAWTPSANLPNGDTYRAYVKTAATTNGVDQWSAWAYTEFTISIALTTPTAVVPEDSSTKTTSKPALGATIGAQTDGILIKRHWQVASDTGFTTNLQEYTDTTATSTKSGTITFPAAWTRLAQGTWYVRCRTEDEYGVTGSYSAYNTFTVAHAPSTSNRNPSSGISIQYTTTPTVDWDFSDPDATDAQTAYEVELWKLSAPGSPIQPGKQTSTNEFHQFSSGIDATWKDTELRWRAKVYDADDVASAWSTDAAFFLRDLPTANITAPVGAGGATNSQPTVTWTFSASGGRTQYSYRVVVTNTDTSTVVADSGVVVGTALSWQVPTPVIVISTNYQIDLTLVDSSGLTGTDTDTFTATYSLPTTPTFVVSDIDFYSESRVNIDWSSATQDGTCLGWRVYRRLASETTWTLLIYDQTPSSDSYVDYTCPENVDVQYSVVQVAESLGDPVESAYPVQNFNGMSDNYFLVCPDNPSLNMMLRQVIADSFEDEQEMAEVNLLGRGRRVSYGTRYGQRGALSAQFWNTDTETARYQRLSVEALRNSGLRIYLKNPFGDVWAVALNSARVSRVAGVGLREHTRLDISYTEITA